MNHAHATIEGFDYERHAVGDATYQVATGGDGPAVFLLHGYPQTHYCWAQVAPALARTHRVIAPDIRGYGASAAPPGGPSGEGFSKREMAADVVALADALGLERFAVVGHDRGGRVAYRAALDHPDRVERLAVLNIVPTVEQFERVSPANAIGYWPWFLLAQPAPFPERLIAGAREHYVTSIIRDWAALADRIPAEAVRHTWMRSATRRSPPPVPTIARASISTASSTRRIAGRGARSNARRWCSGASSTRGSARTTVRWTRGGAGPARSRARPCRAVTSSPRRPRTS